MKNRVLAYLWIFREFFGLFQLVIFSPTLFSLSRPSSQTKKVSSKAIFRSNCKLARKVCIKKQVKTGFETCKTHGKVGKKFLCSPLSKTIDLMAYGVSNGFSCFTCSQKFIIVFVHMQTWYRWGSFEKSRFLKIVNSAKFFFFKKDSAILHRRNLFEKRMRFDKSR